MALAYGQITAAQRGWLSRRRSRHIQTLNGIVITTMGRLIFGIGGSCSDQMLLLDMIYGIKLETY